MRFDILTLFPNLVEPYLADSILARAIKNKKITVKVHNVRDFSTDKHHTVDDAPYGGGAGMVQKVDVWFRALKKIVGTKEINKRLRSKHKPLSPITYNLKPRTRIVLLDPAGKQFTHTMAAHYSKKYNRIVFLCGRYEGFDARIHHVIDERVSVGPYVLSGGELPALTILEATARLLPGVLGNAESLTSETSGAAPDFPVYTRPATFSPQKGVAWRVPRILLSGHAKNIEIWRRKQQKPRP